jgi:hypothetical protein
MKCSHKRSQYEDKNWQKRTDGDYARMRKASSSIDWLRHDGEHIFLQFSHFGIVIVE